MRAVKALFLSAAAFVVFSVSGCGVDQAFVKGVDQYANKSGLLDEYDKYVEADQKLDADTKKIRKDTSAGLRKLIEEGKD